MPSTRSEGLSLAEAGALALADAASDLDRADNARKFLEALERNRRIWTRIGQLAASLAWSVPDQRMVDYALKTSGQASGRAGRDDHIHTLIDINRQVSLALTEGGDMDRIRKRAQAIWETQNHPHGKDTGGKDTGGKDLGLWLIAEMDTGAG